MMTSSKETLGQNRAQLAAGVQGSQARGHGGLSRGGAATGRARPRQSSQARRPAVSWCCVLGAPALLAQALVALAAPMSVMAGLEAAAPARVSATASPEDEQPRLPETTEFICFPQRA